MNESLQKELLEARKQIKILQDKLSRTSKKIKSIEKEKINKLEHHNSVLRAIRNVNQLIVKEKDPDKLIIETCNHLVETRSYLNAWICLYDGKDNLKNVSSRGFGKEFSAVKKILKEGKKVYCQKKAFKEKGVHVIEDPYKNCKNCPLSSKYIGRATLVRQLEYEGTIYGTITVSVDQEMTDDEEEQQLFNELGGDLSFVLHSIEIEEKAKRMEKELKQSEEKYRQLHESMGDAFVTTDMEGNIIEYNQEYLNMLGYDEDEIEKLTHIDLTPKKWHEMESKIVEDQIMKKGYSAVYEKEYMKKDGTIIPIELRTFLIRDEDNKVKGMWSIVRDISEPKRIIMNNLQKNKELLTNVFESMKEGILVLDKHYRYTYWNKSMETMSNISREDVLGKIPWEMFTFIKGRVKEAMKKAMRGHTLHNIELKFTLADGNKGWTSESYLPLKDKLGNIVGVVGVVEEITERKQAEEELLKAKKEWEAIFQAIGHPTFIIDSNHTIISTNKATQKAIGISEEQLKGKKCYQIFHTTKKPPKNCPAKILLQSGKIKTVEMKVEALHGTYIISTTPLVDEKGIINKIIHIATDITTRKKAQEALKKSEEKYRELFNTALVGISVHDSAGYILAANKKAEKVFGFSEEELKKKDLNFWKGKLINPDGTAMKQSEFPLSVVTKSKIASEGRIVGLLMRENDEIRWFLHSARPIINKLNQIELVVTSFVDITKRKKAEEELRQNKEKLRLVTENIQEVFWMSKPGITKMLYINKAYEDIWGKSIKSLYESPKSFLESIHPNDLEQYLQLIDKFHSKGKKYKYEYRITGADGEIHWIDERGYPICDDNGTVVLMTGTCRDITERKQALKKLKESEKHFKSLFNLMVDPVVIVDKKGKFLEITDKMEEITGFKKEDFIGKNFMQTKIVTAKSKAILIKNLTKRLMGIKIAPYEVEILTKDGEKLAFEVNAEKVNYKGIPADLVAFRDINERKRAERIRNTIFNISHAVNTIENIDELYKMIRDYLSNIIDTTNFYIALYNEEKDTLTLPFMDDEKDSFKEYPSGKTLSSYVIKTGKPLLATKKVINDLTKKGIIEAIGTPSEIWLGVPLKLHKHVIGLIAVQSYEDPEHYTKKDLEILNFVSNEIALAIQHMQADERIKIQLKEKEVLLNEIHHRVKNNLQTILSLLQLQQDTIQSKEDAIQAFEVSQDRIFAMARVHEMLLRSEYMSKINVGEYIKVVSENIRNSYDHENKVKISYKLDKYFMDIQKLGKLGLIINELITNVFKYAFEGLEKGTLSIHFKVRNNECNIIIEDDGIGIPKTIKVPNSESLGLRLVDMLMHEMQGTYSVSRIKGTKFTLKLPITS